MPFQIDKRGDGVHNDKSFVEISSIVMHGDDSTCCDRVLLNDDDVCMVRTGITCRSCGTRPV